MNIDDLLHVVSSQKELSNDEELNKRATELILDSHRKDVEKKAEEIEGLKQDRQQRRIFSYCIFGFMCIYMAVAIALWAWIYVSKRVGSYYFAYHDFS